MANTYVLISSSTPTGVSTVTFSSIPQTYTDLVLMASVRSPAASGDNLKMTINGSSSASYSTTLLWGYGTSPGSNRTTTGGAHGAYILIPEINAANYTANTFSPLEVYIPNYTITTNKQISFFEVAENNSTSLSAIQAGAGYIQISAAVTSITVTDYNSQNFVTGSSFYLYGIKKN